MSEDRLSTRDIAGSRADDVQIKQAELDRQDLNRHTELNARDDLGHTGEPRMAEAAAVRTATPQRAADEAGTPLFHSEESQGYRTRWDAIQTGFVDEPRRTVEEADNLVADVMKRLAEVFADERSAMERQWGKGDQVSTEDLRQALRRYRTFFQRLLDI